MWGRSADLQQVDEPVKAVGPVQLERDPELGDDLAELPTQKTPNGSLGGLCVSAKPPYRIGLVWGAPAARTKNTPAQPGP